VQCDDSDDEGREGDGTGKTPLSPNASDHARLDKEGEEDFDAGRVLCRLDSKQVQR